jgi:hypothetical protein
MSGLKKLISLFLATVFASARVVFKHHVQHLMDKRIQVHLDAICGSLALVFFQIMGRDCYLDIGSVEWKVLV